MIRVVEVTTIPYDQGEHGYFQSKRRRTRIRFNVEVMDRHGKKHHVAPYRTEHPEKTLRLLLPSIYEKLRGNPLAPLPFPDKINAHWSNDEQAFVLIRGGFTGYEIVATLEQRPDNGETDAIEADEADAVRLHGTPLPGLGR